MGLADAHVRYTVQDDGVTLRRSEPSETLTFTPDGSSESVEITKPYTHVGILNRFGVMAGALVAKAEDGATVDVIVTRDFGLEQLPPISVDLSPEDSETQVIRPLDNLSMSELTVVQIEFQDPDTPGARWELNGLALKERKEQTA